MPFALLYVSRSRLRGAARATELARILEVSLECNQSNSITGALVSTPDHFAQVLEGPRAAVTELMTRIEADPRHRDVAVLARETVPQRSFARWSLAHIGTSRPLSEAIEKFTDATSDRVAPGDVWSLWTMMSAMASEQFRADPSRST